MNNQPKHTPGPWSEESSGDIIDSTGVILARLAMRPNEEQESANARLIAAAPELLEATKDSLNTLLALESFVDSKAARKTLTAEINSLRKAIAKAEGQ